MHDEDVKQAEVHLRERAAAALQSARLVPEKKAPFVRFEITPDQDAAVKRSQEELEDQAKSVFGA